MVRGHPLPFLAILLFLAPQALKAQATYRIQPIVKAGDAVQGTRIKADASFAVGTLNDKGQLLFTAGSAGGGQVLIQSADGQLTVVAGAGGTAPGGTWPQDLFFFAPVSMNQLGQAVFAAPVTVGGQGSVGTFRMQYPSREIGVVVRDGMPAGDGLTFGEGGAAAPVINNHGEIAFSAAVKDASGTLLGYGVFFQGTDGKLQPVALPGQSLPDGALVGTAYSPSLNDAGTVAFLAVREVDDDDHAAIAHAAAAGRAAYLWEHVAISLLPRGPLSTPPGLSLLGASGVWVNNQNPNVLLTELVDSPAGPVSCPYLLTGSASIPVALPGSPMPGGGRFLALQTNGVSSADEMGRHALLALLQDGSTAAYLMDAAGQLSLLLKSGTTTPLGLISNVGQGAGFSLGIGLNAAGQAGFTVQVANGPDTLALLTP